MTIGLTFFYCPPDSSLIEKEIKNSNQTTFRRHKKSVSKIKLDVDINNININ